MQLYSNYVFTREERVKNGRKGAYVAGYKPYSTRETQYLISNYRKLTLRQIAIDLERSYPSVKAKSKKLIKQGLLPNDRQWHNCHYTKEEDQFIKDSCHSMSFHDVGLILGRSRDSVKVRAMKLGVSFRKIGETSPVCKLTNEDVEFIRELADAGLNYCEIARKFEIDNSHARGICIFESRLYLDQADYLTAMERQTSAIDNND